MYFPTMPQYDESFIRDDNQNQKRNKRSYRVYKNGSKPPCLESNDTSQAAEERGASVIKRNMRNIKQRGQRYRAEHEGQTPQQHATAHKNRMLDIFSYRYPRISVFDPNTLYDIRNNNMPPLSSCKSFDNLTLKKDKRDFAKSVIKSGVSLQNLTRDESVKHFSSPAEDISGYYRADVRNSYSVAEARRRPIQRRVSRSTAVPGVGIYRKITGDAGGERKVNEGEACAEAGSGHRGSLRGANKLARRARSFKDDLLERISNMRSPAQPPHNHHLNSNLRSHSPLSPKPRNMGVKPVASEEGEITPAKELERLVKEVTFGLKHFSDVITKRKLEMLPDNGTIVFESIANIHKAIKPYCSRSPPLMTAVKRLCTALAMLIRLCDEVTVVALKADAEEAQADASLSPEHVTSVVHGLTAAVDEVAGLAQQHMTRPALSPRPALVSPRSTQRNSLPDIPLTPKERSLLTGEPGTEPNGVRASHSSESILDDTPPPKPARPIRKIELAPPLPPKRRSANDNSLRLSVERLSLQSHSSGSLDSMLNVSNDDERVPLDGHEVYVTPPNSDLVGMCSCSNVSDMRTSVESHDSHSNHAHGHNNHNRFSNESGFVSVGHAEISTEHSFTSTFSSHHYSSHADRLASIAADDGETPPELPAKTKRVMRADMQQYFSNVEYRNPAFSLHEPRPHTLAEHNQRPPPLPLKKKHIMAYMEMFGNCSHTVSTHPPINPEAPPDMFRHSIHTYNLTSAQLSSSGSLSLGHQQVQRALASSVTVQHLSTPPLSVNSGSEDSVSIRTPSRTSPAPPPPPALPPKLHRINKQVSTNSSNELLPPPSPRLSSHSSLADDCRLNNTSTDDLYVSSSSPGKFPLDEEELERLALPMPSPVPSQRSESSAECTMSLAEEASTPVPAADDIVLQTDVGTWLLLKTAEKEGPDVRGGHPDALVVLATKATKDFAYQEAFLATYRTWVSPSDLVKKLIRRANHFKPRPHELRSTLSLLTRVVADLTMSDLDQTLMKEIMEFIYWLVEAEELPISKALRQILVDKQKQIHFQHSNKGYEYETPCVSLRRDSLLDFKPSELAEQMTLLDAALFARITGAEVLSWPRDQSEESSPNLTRFTEHFNKMSYWARSRILEQYEAREREKYANKVLKVMKVLRKMNNFNSYLALVSALDCPPVQRLGWPRATQDALRDHCALIDSSHSFRAYRQALAETQPPCIPYIGLFLQDLTFIHVGNPDLLPDGNINFTKRWQQYHIMENMKRFHKDRQYKFKKNERIQAMFNEFDDVLSEDTMWQISYAIKPQRGRSRNASAPSPPAPAPAPAPAAASAAAAAT